MEKSPSDHNGTYHRSRESRCRKLRFQFLAPSLSSENTLLSQIVTQDPPHLQILFATSLQPLVYTTTFSIMTSASTNLIRRVIVDGFPPRFNVGLMLGRSSTRLQVLSCEAGKAPGCSTVYRENNLKDYKHSMNKYASQYSQFALEIKSLYRLRIG